MDIDQSINQDITYTGKQNNSFNVIGENLEQMHVEETMLIFSQLWKINFRKMCTTKLVYVCSSLLEECLTIFLQVLKALQLLNVQSSCILHVTDSQGFKYIHSVPPSPKKGQRKTIV